MARAVISRRGFVGLLGVAATAVAVAPASALTLDETRYRNRRLGFEFEKPRTWHYLTFQEFLEAGADVETEYEALQALRRSQGAPVVAVALHYKTPPDFSPSIVVYGEAPEAPWPPEDVLAVDLSDFGRSIRDFELLEQGVLDPIGASIAARATYSYRAESISGESVRMRTRCHSVVHRGAVLSFNFTELCDGPPKISTALQASRASIRLFGAHAA